MAAAGLRYTDFVTQFPSQFTMATSFDRDLVQEMTERMSAEFAGKGVNVQLGPVSWLAGWLAGWLAEGDADDSSLVVRWAGRRSVGGTGRVSV